MLILFFGSNGVPFDVNSPLGSFSYLTYCAAPGLAIHTFYVTVAIIFFIVFCVIDSLGFHWSV